MKDSSSKPGQYIWENLIYENDNIRCLLCGHVRPRVQFIFSENACGRSVPQIEFNIQHEPHGGNGLIQLWEFPQNDDNVYVKTFNAYQQKFVSDSTSDFHFRYR